MVRNLILRQKQTCSKLFTKEEFDRPYIFYRILYRFSDCSKLREKRKAVVLLHVPYVSTSAWGASVVLRRESINLTIPTVHSEAIIFPQALWTTSPQSFYVLSLATEMALVSPGISFDQERLPAGKALLNVIVTKDATTNDLSSPSLWFSLDKGEDLNLSYSVNDSTALELYSKMSMSQMEKLDLSGKLSCRDVGEVKDKSAALYFIFPLPADAYNWIDFEDLEAFFSSYLAHYRYPPEKELFKKILWDYFMKSGFDPEWVDSFFCDLEEMEKYYEISWGYHDFVVVCQRRYIYPSPDKVLELRFIKKLRKSEC